MQEGYEGTSSAWVSSLHGEAGLSAYEVAVQEGYGGLRSEWLAELRGDKGEPGATGSRGRQGDVGPDGKSAYQLAKDLEGFDLSLENWLETLHGADGESAYQLARRLGFVGTEREWLESLKGRDGLDGKDGNDGVTGPRGSKGDTGQEGPRGRPGTDGQDGKSAYEIAVAHGFEGTEEDWVRSQRGIEDAPADGYQYLRKDEGWVRFDFTTVGDDTVLDAGVMAGTALSKVVAQTDLNYFEYS